MTPPGRLQRINLIKLDEILSSPNHQWYINKIESAEKSTGNPELWSFQKQYIEMKNSFSFASSI